MKGINLFLAACFIVPFSYGAMAENTKIPSRATITRGQSNAYTGATRNTNTVKQRGATTKYATNKNVVSRTPRLLTPEKNRNVQQTRSAQIVARTAQNPTTTQRTIAREATTTPTTKTRESVINRNFGKCKSVFFDCMDEFCANKDTQLKRCACSARSTDFKTTQKSLDNVENNLLDFSQRLLKVNMDPADAAAINQASEGEIAYYATKDNTKSKKTLNNIAQKLNAGFNYADNNSNTLALTWTLDADSAFDSVDSLSGIATTTKSGIALRNAALPICREMAAEVCEEEDKSLVETSYNMAIEQDCTTVQRAYTTQTQNARNKILESAALLDMTRLNTYQENNSDDILQCKAKMLDALTNTTVCGENLTQCLDISGRYINPTTGEALLTPNLVNLSKLISRPTGTETWAGTPNNKSFVSYLNNKKKYIETSTKNCQSISDDIWDDFIEDALAKIKLAQDAKLEEIRQSCTTLLSECITEAKETLTDFDSRALSIFGVMTDKTANALCEDIKTSCSSVLEYTPDTSVATATLRTIGSRWAQGVTDIEAQETYNTILSTCNEVGRNCIINTCYSINGNFGLCENIHDSINRHSILTHAACWNEVYDCVAKATDESLTNIHALLPNYGTGPSALYATLYNTNARIYDICRDQSISMPDGTTDPCSPLSGNATDPDKQSVECYRCRLAEQIWGNCEHKPDSSQTNKILIPSDSNKSNLLSWFAHNTHTQDDPDSCAISMCPSSQIAVTIGTSAMCVSPNEVLQCPANGTTASTNILCTNQISVISNSIYNCCPTAMTDKWGNCCRNGVSSEIIPHGSAGVLQSNYPMLTLTDNSKICTNGASQLTLLHRNTSGSNEKLIFCDGTVSGNASNLSTVNCSGQYIVLDCNTTTSTCTYSNPTPGNPTSSNNIASFNYDINYYVNIDATNPARMPAGRLSNYCATYNAASDRNSDTSNICRATGVNTWDNGCATPTRWIIDFNRH